MATRAKSKRTVRPHDPPKPPIDSSLPPGVNRSSSVPDGVELQAQRLVHNAGSAEDAKKAIDAAVGKEAVGDFRQDTFALRFGFASRRDLLAASKPLFDSQTSSWWATELKNGRWIVWGADDLSATQTFESLVEARQAVGDPLGGTAE
jgi:hypothetical protein